MNISTVMQQKPELYGKVSNEPAGKPTEAETEPVGVREDSVQLSAEARKRRKIEAEEAKQIEIAKQKEQMKQQAEAAKQQAEAAAKALEMELKCMEIAMAIISGNNVAPADHQYLVKNNPELYGRALSMRIEKQDPEDLKQISEEEEDTQASKATETADENQDQVQPTEAVTLSAENAAQ